MKKPTALITGGAGFIGSHLADKLLQNGHEVTVIDNLVGGRKKNLEKASKYSNFHFIEHDIRNYNEIEKHFEKKDWVFHLAALADIVPSIENPQEYFDTNVKGTINVLEASKKFSVKKFLYAASSSCYGIPNQYPTSEASPISPEYPYALTKNLGEQLVLHWANVYKIPAISLRLFNVFGPRSRTSGVYGAVFGVFLTQKIHQKPFTVVGDGKQTRDFTFVSDVVDASCKAAESNIVNDFFNVGSAGHYSIQKLVELLKGEIIYIPKRPGEPDCTFADISKIKAKLNWSPKISFEEGVKILLDHINDFKDAPLWEPKNIEKATEKWFKFLGNHV